MKRLQVLGIVAAAVIAAAPMAEAAPFQIQGICMGVHAGGVKAAYRITNVHNTDCDFKGRSGDAKADLNMHSVFAGVNWHF